MKIQEIEIDQIIPYINNPRKNLNSDKVASSIKEFGFQQPIVLDNSYKIIVGHTRYEASKKLGLKKVPVVIADLTPTQAKAYRIADNRLNEDSDWDYSKLNLEFTDLLDNHFELNDLGFDSHEIENMLAYEPKFERTNDLEGDTELETEEHQKANIRMLQLFLDPEKEKEFKKMVHWLIDNGHLGTDNITDTVYEVVKTFYENSKTRAETK